MEFIIKKTTELTDEEKQSLLNCFVEVFEHERSLEEMCNQYLNTPMGYSIHSLCIDNGEIVAAHTAFPSYYWVREQKVKAYITGDNMVKKEYRDGSVFLDVNLGLTSYMKKDGYAFAFGFPNKSAYVVTKRGKLAVEIGRLDTYILPYRIGGIKSVLTWLNPVSKLLCHGWMLGCSLGSKVVEEIAVVHKDDESYNPSRYRRMDNDYQHVKQDNTEFYYKIKTHEGIRTAFLIDVIGKSEKRFQNAVQFIVQKEKENFDLLMFVGHLPEKVKKIGLIKIPRNIEPKHFYMTGKVYDKSIDKDLIYNIDNWDVNLSDYDLI